MKYLPVYHSTLLYPPQYFILLVSPYPYISFLSMLPNFNIYFPNILSPEYVIPVVCQPPLSHPSLYITPQNITLPIYLTPLRQSLCVQSLYIGFALCISPHASFVPQTVSYSTGYHSLVCNHLVHNYFWYVTTSQYANPQYIKFYIVWNMQAFHPLLFMQFCYKDII